MEARDLLAHLTSSDESTRHRARLALGGGGRNAGWVPDLIAGTTHADGRIRMWAAIALGGMGRDAAEAVPALVVMLSDSAFGNRTAAAATLAGIGPPATEAGIPELARLMESDDSHVVRRSAVRALGDLAVFDVDAIPAVAAGLDDPHDSVRGEAAVQLKLLGGCAAQALPALHRLLEKADETENVRSQATAALETIGSGAPAYRSDEPYRSLNDAAARGRFSQARLPVEVRAHLDREEYEPALRLLETGAEGAQDSMFWLSMMAAAGRLGLAESDRYHERYLETSGLGGFWREMKTEIQSQRTVAQGMRRVVRYCANVDPDPRWKRFSELAVQDDLARLRAWLEAVLTDDPPPAEITGLWFGLVNLDRAGKPTLDMYVAGERHSGDPADQVIGGSWRPRPA